MNPFIEIALRGSRLGFFLSLPLGATGFIILRRCVLFGSKRAINSAMAPMTIDGIAVIAVLAFIHWVGHTIPDKVIKDLIPWLIFLAGSIFIIMGIKMAKMNFSDDVEPEKDYISTLVVSAMSGATILGACIGSVPLAGGELLLVSVWYKVFFYLGCLTGEIITWYGQFVIVWLLCVRFHVFKIETLANLFARLILVAGICMTSWFIISRLLFR